MSLRIEILEHNFVAIYQDGTEHPVHVTPGWPNGDRFETEEDARGWAEMFVESIEDPTAPFAPVHKGAERLPKLTQEAIAALDAQRQQAELHDENLPEYTIIEQPSE